MKLYANALNRNYLRSVLPGPNDEVEWVKAAIAYGDDERTLVQSCLDKRKRLDIWMRYDHTVPVAPKLLRHLLSCASRNVFCRLVPDVLHAKVIWWRGYGVYIGSANLTDRAWMTSIELGAFLPESELEAGQQMGELERFFDTLDGYDRVFDLTEEVIREQEAIQRERSKDDAEVNAKARRRRSVPEWSGPDFAGDRQNVINRQRDQFVKEWRSGVAILDGLAEQAPHYRPVWLHADVPSRWQADQFLHAYYYNRVAEGAAHPFEDHYRANFRDPQGASKAALEWWADLPSPPSDEDINCHERAPTIRRILHQDRHHLMSSDDLYELLQANHSSRDHIRRMTLSQLHVDVADADGVDRIRAFADWLWKQRNASGESFFELIRYVIDGGTVADLPIRLFDATEARAFAHVGKNQLAEIAGWARPEKYGPRNGRTSKALRALGYNVRVY
ncbi:hypothetical protein [Luteimonas abyssi]|uniref:hypothetical protein n=1 Tax=Luteimonas abyssi TaxID=1247514 RepID=UPI000737C199|nr:hypothetical protein [Luteimonas abyssi]